MTKATRADVARRAGVSPALVSYVLNGGPRPVSAAARERIEAAIEELGYRPNPIAQALRGGATGIVGLLMPTPVNPFFAEFAYAIETEVFQQGSILAVGVTEDDPVREQRYLTALIDRQVDGLMIVSTHALESLGQLGQLGPAPPVIVLDRLSQELTQATGPSSVTVRNYAGASLAVEHLVGHGHRVIGCVAGWDGVQPATERYEAWRATLERAGLPHDERLVRHCAFTAQDGCAAARDLLRESATWPKEERITALFVSADVQALGVMAACDELGLKIGQDIAIASFDGTQAGALQRPQLTSYRQPMEEMAAHAVRHLFERITDPDIPPTHEDMAGSLTIGHSCGC